MYKQSTRNTGELTKENGWKSNIEKPILAEYDGIHL
jgi:hypothetical protein